MILHINVTDKIATYQKRDGDIVCGNSDYQIQFIFDAEWESRGAKIARVIYNGQYVDTPIENDICSLPVVRNTDSIQIGVYTSDGMWHTTTPAYIKCHKSILCGADKLESAPENDIDYATEAGKSAIRAEAAASRAETLVGDAEEAINNCENVAQDLLQAKENGMFDGRNFVWCGEFDISKSYKVDDVVEYGGSVYICIQDKDNDQDPTTHPDYWQLFVAKGKDGTDGVNGKDGTDGKDGTSFIWRGEFNEQIDYKINDVVEYNGSAYVCIKNKDNDQNPTDPLYWQLLVAKGKDGHDGAGLSDLTDLETTALAVEIDEEGFTIEGGATFKTTDGSSYPIGSYIRIPLVAGEGVSIDNNRADKVVITLDSKAINTVLSNYYTKTEVKEYIDEYINSALGGDY